MSRLNATNGTLLSALNNNTPFIYAHLVKFERAVSEETTNNLMSVGTNGNKYAYITDAGYNVTWDDGSTYLNSSDVLTNNGNREYVANKLLKVGSVTESTRIKVDGMSIDLDATALDTEVTSTFTVTASEIQGEKGVDLAAAGFKVGDKIRFTDNASSELIITGFKGDSQTPSNRNARMTYTLLSGSQGAFNSTEKTLTLISEEIKFLTDSSQDTSFVNRQVIVYKAFFYADNPHTLIGTPIKLFDGIVTAGTYKESPTGSARISWSLKSHWGDFEQLRGRVTSADFHQALDQNGRPQRNSTLKPAYAEDFGFAHSEVALNVIAQYQDVEKQLKEKKKKKWYGMTKYKYTEVDVEVTRETDIRFDLQARRIPLIYGVVRTKPIPVFADIAANAADNNKVFKVDALCEGPIQSIMNIYVEDMPLVCVDSADATARSTGSEAVDIRCSGRTDQGNVLQGDAQSSTDPRVNWIGVDEYAALQEEDPSQASTYTPVTRQGVVIAYQPAGTSSFTNVGQKGITHEKRVTFQDPQPWQLEFHGGYEDQAASSMISTRANTAGQKFRIQEDYWTPSANSGVEYWGPKHQLLDTAYAAVNFELTPDQTQVPTVEYVVKGKLIECFNYDGSYNHNELPTYTSESIDNFTEGTSYDLKTRRSFTDEDGNSHSANSTLFSATLIEKFFFYDGEGNTNHRARWALTGDQQDLLNAAKDFYMTDGTNNWSMVTWDGTADIDTNFAVTEVFETTVSSSPSSSGSSAYTTSFSSPSTNFTGEVDTQALLRFIGDAEVGAYGSRANFYTQALAASISGSNITFANTNSTVTPSQTKVLVTNKLKISNAASSTDNFYNDMKCIITQTLPSGKRIRARKRIKDYDGSSRVLTFEEEITEFKPAVGDKVEIIPRKGLMYGGPIEGTDLRPSNNFAMILLDYISSTTYGPGVDIKTQIDLDTFRLAGQMCDTQSDVTVKFASNVSLTAGDVYRYYEGSHEKWRGTVKTTANSSSHTFTNVTGKLANRYNDFSSRKIGDLVYTYNGTDLYEVSSAGVQSSISNNASTVSAPVLRKVSGSGPATATMIGHGTGTPVTGYSLYDCDDVKFWKYLGWEEKRQRYVTRHQGNIKLDTNQTVFQIIQGLLGQFNGQLMFVDGKYKLVVESTRTSDELDSVFTNTIGGNSPTVADLDIRARYITDEDIIGNISIKDDGLSKSFNSLSASILDPQLNFDSRSVSFFNSEYLKADRGIVRSTNFTAGGITNYYNARMMVKQTLDKSRFNRKISFTMRPVGLSALPGELIRIEYDRFGWTSSSPKLFRIETVTLKEDCLIGITAEEYDDSVYIIDPPRVSAFYIDTKQAAVARVPSAPTNVSVSTSGPAGANVVSWTASSGLSEDGKYEVWRATSKSGNPSTSVVSHATKLDFEASTTSYTDIGFTNTSNVTYYYWVRAFNRMAQQTTSGTDQKQKKYFSPFNANSNYGDATDAAETGRAVADGVSPISINIKNSAVLAACESDGTLILSGGQIPDSGNEIQAFEGTTALQFDGTGTNNGTFNVTITATNVTAGSIVDSGSFATINPATGMSQNIGTLVFTISGKTSAGTSFSATRTQSFTKAIPGKMGKAVELTPSKYVINYTKSGSESDSITFTATPRNTSDITPHYEFSVGGTPRQSYSATNTYTLPDNLEPATGTSVLVAVNVKDGGSGPVLAGDSVSIYGVQDGSDAAIGFLTNPSHTVPAANNGDLTSGALNDADGTFKVFLGGSEITSNSAVTFAASGATGMAATINSNTGVYQATAFNSDSGTITFTATIAANASLGTASAITIEQIFSMSKAKTGDDGQSITGATGPRTTTARLFYSVAASSAPTAPTSSNTNTFVFSSATFTNRASNWNHNPPTFAGSNQNKYWYIPFTVTEASFGGTQTVTFGSVTQAIGFSGLVTFSNGDTFGDGTNTMSFGASGTTSINGGNITTGVINLGNASGMAIRQGKTSYSSNTTGFWLGNDSGTPKFHIGTSSNFLKFTGSNLEVAGTLKMVSGGSTTTLTNTNTLNSNTTDADILGAGNSFSDAATTDVSTIRSGTTADNVGLGNVDNSNFNSSGDIIGGHIGGINIDASKIWAGTGSYNNTNTPVYLDNNGFFSLENKLKWHPTNNRLDIDGHLTVRSISFLSGSSVDFDDVSGSNKPADNATNTNAPESAAHTSGSVGGWNLNANNIYSGTSPDASGYTSSGMTLNSAGSIHSKEFYIDTSGNAHFKGNIESGGTVSAEAIDLNGTTITASASGLSLNTFDAFTHINTDTMGNIEGTGGHDVFIENSGHVHGSIFLAAEPKHIAGSSSTHVDPSVTAGNVLGGQSDNANGSPLFQYGFATPAFSGTRKYLVQVSLNPIGLVGSSDMSIFAFAMRATSSATAYTATSSSSYVTTRGTSISGENAGALYVLSDVVNLTGNTNYYIWVFGAIEGFGNGSHATIDHGILDGSITVAGLAK